jgi:hypothetical protein
MASETFQSKARTGVPGLDEGHRARAVHDPRPGAAAQGGAEAVQRTGPRHARRALVAAGRPPSPARRGRGCRGRAARQLAEEARRLRPDLPILLATGYADLPATTSLDLPRLSKPYQQRQLAEQIDHLLG